MDIVRIKKQKNTLIIKATYEGLNVNKNAFNCEVLYYTKKYLKENKKSVKSVLSFYNIDTVIYKDEESFLATFELIVADNIVFDYKDSLSLRVLNRLIKSNYKRIECFFMPGDYVHEFSKKNVSVIFKNDLAFTSDFVKYNDLNNLKQVYYKKDINFYSKREIRDNFKHFLDINKGLKIINMYYYSKEDTTFIINAIKEKSKKGIRVFIHQNEDNAPVIGRDVNYLKKLNKDEDFELKIIYDEEFFDKRVFSLFSNNVLKLASIIVIYVGIVLMFSTRFSEYSAALEIRKLETDLIENDDLTLEEAIVVDEVDDIKENTQTTISEEHIETREVVNYSNIPKSYEKLSKINPDVVGWIKVNNTSINYPVLQSTDNDYYLKHDIYGNEMISGWIFMDYRNNSKDLNKNTIIYGHAARSGLMFGTLYKTTYDWWINNDKNHIITFNTLDEETSYQIFSIYKTDVTSDYLRVNFSNSEDYMSFIEMIKNRSIHNFDVEIKEDDKIITLSTCSGTNRRLVIHAKKL